MVLSYYTRPESWRCCTRVHQSLTPASELQCGKDWNPTGKNQAQMCFTVPHRKLLRNRYTSSCSRLNWQARRHQPETESSCSNFGQDRSKNVGCNSFNTTLPKAARTSPLYTQSALLTGIVRACITLMGHRDGKAGVMYIAPSKNLDKGTETWIWL